jgi:hypothetical protein
LPKSEILELRRQLAAEGVTLPKLQPTHDNVAKAVMQHWAGVAR